MNGLPRGNLELLAIAERKMQEWELNNQLAEILQQGEEPAPASKIMEYIAISRECGSCGTEVGEVLGVRLGWNVLDRKLLHRIAEKYELPLCGLEDIDETGVNWLYDTIGPLIDSKIVPHEKYLMCLKRIMRYLAGEEHFVFIGRAAHQFLPRRRGLAVRIVASEKYRIEQFQARHDITSAKAKKLVRAKDRERRVFMKQFGRCDIKDPLVYDLVVNIESLGFDQTVELIEDTFRRRFPSYEDVEAVASGA